MIPALILLVCTEGYNCSRPEREIYPMPDWDTCFRAAQSATFNPVPQVIETGRSYDQPFVAGMFCGSTPDPDGDS